MMQNQASGSTLSDVGGGVISVLVAKERSAIERNGRLHYVHWLVLILSVLLTLGVWQYSKAQVEQRTQARFDAAANHTKNLILDRLQKYELALWAGVSAIKQNGNQITLNEWREFSTSLNIGHRYPGINGIGIGIIHQVDRSEMDNYLASQRDARPNFQIHPPHKEDVFMPITLIEPVNINAEAVGLDMMHEINRHTALLKARDTGNALITAPITLVQDHDHTPGFLFLAPFFKGHDAQPIPKHKNSFLGAVYAPFIVEKLINSVLVKKNQRVTALRISDSGVVIYDDIVPTNADYDPELLAITRITIPIYGHEWTMDLRTGLEFRNNNSGPESNIILIFGIVINLGILSLILLTIQAYRRGLQFSDFSTSAFDSETIALKSANQKLDIARANAENTSEIKSNFLATMSHEVRTPYRNQRYF